MALSVSSRVEDGLAVLELAGTLTLGPTLSGLRGSARQIFQQHKVSGMILEVGGITVTDSSGLGELTVLYTLAANRNCGIRLVGVSPNLRRMLEMTRIDELLPASPSLASAKAELRLASA